MLKAIGDGRRGAGVKAPNEQMGKGPTSSVVQRDDGASSLRSPSEDRKLGLNPGFILCINSLDEHPSPSSGKSMTTVTNSDVVEYSPASSRRNTVKYPLRGTQLPCISPPVPV